MGIGGWGDLRIDISLFWSVLSSVVQGGGVHIHTHGIPPTYLPRYLPTYLPACLRQWWVASQLCSSTLSHPVTGQTDR